MSRAAWKVQLQLQKNYSSSIHRPTAIFAFPLLLNIPPLVQFILQHIMSELAFAKSFLSSLDSRPIKIRADHVFDPERVGLRVPVCLSP